MASPQRLQDHDRHEGGDNVEPWPDDEAGAPMLPGRVIEQIGEWDGQGRHALRGEQHAVVRRRLLATVMVGERRGNSE